MVGRKKAKKVEQLEDAEIAPVKEEFVVKPLEELTLRDITIKEFGSTEESKPKKISPGSREKLASIGITDPMTLATANIEDLVYVIEMSRDDAANMIQGAQLLLAKHKVIEKGAMSGTEKLESRKKVLRLKTGSVKLDEILKGGIETDAVTEIVAEFASGKTQICFTLAVLAQKPVEEGGLGGGCIWIDTEGTFRPERIEQIAKVRGLDPQATLQNILTSRMVNASHLEMFVKSLSEFIQKYKLKLVVVDSVIALHRAEFSGRGTLADRQHRLGVILHQLVKVAELNHVAVVITNQVMANPAGFYGAPDTKPTGGHVLSHSSTYRLSMHKAGGNARIIRIVDSPYHAYTDCKIELGPEGITDLKEKEK